MTYLPSLIWIYVLYGTYAAQVRGSDVNCWLALPLFPGCLIGGLRFSSAQLGLLYRKCLPVTSMEITSTKDMMSGAALISPSHLTYLYTKHQVMKSTSSLLNPVKF